MKKKIIASILLVSVVMLCSCDMKRTHETEATDDTEVTEETEETEITEETTEATAKVVIVEPDIEPSESELKIQPIEDPVEIDEDPFENPAEANPDDFNNQFLKDFITAYKDDPNYIIVPVVGNARSRSEIEQGIVEAILVRRAGEFSTNIYIQFDTIENAQAYLIYVIYSLKESGAIDSTSELETVELDKEYEFGNLRVSITSDAFLTMKTW
ncbi:MAG: hypothetical protein J6U54_08400 [Clostridiales bacterium]|nr:hypothetical protein [Clostridiales bacterium]